MFASPAFPGNTENCFASTLATLGSRYVFRCLDFRLAGGVRSREGETGITIPRSQPACCLQRRGAAPYPVIHCRQMKGSWIRSFSATPSIDPKVNFVNPVFLLFVVQELGVKEPVCWLSGHLMSLDLSFLFCKGIKLN